MARPCASRMKSWNMVPRFPPPAQLSPIFGRALSVMISRARPPCSRAIPLPDSRNADSDHHAVAVRNAAARRWVILA